MPEDSQNTEKLRTQAEQLLSQARAQSIEIQRALGAITGNDALQSRLAAGAAQISGVIGQLSLALNSPGFALHQINLAALEGVVHSDEIGSLVTQAVAQAKGSAALAEAVVTASAATRKEAQTLSHDMFERHIFDPYLHFDSAEDEAAFRRREAEAQKYIAGQLARHTPEGDLNAGGGALGYMLDAHTHGAGNRPEFMRRWDAMVEKTQSERAAMVAAGQSTEEFDRRMTAHARDFLKAQKLSDAEIDARLASADSPLDAVKPFLTQNAGGRVLEHQIRAAADAAQLSPLCGPARIEVSDETSAPTIPVSIDPDAIQAKLKAAGLLVSDNVDPLSGHGLTIQKPVGKPGQSVTG